MRRYPLLLLMLGLLGLFSVGCDSADDESGTVTLTGQVLDNATSNPVPFAFVRVIPSTALDVTDEILVEADEQGRFSIDVKIEETTDLRIQASKDAFSTDDVTVLAIAGRTIEVPTFRLKRTRAEEPSSGRPSNLLLIGQTEPVIGVIESGSVEVTNITFQVADSAGRPVTLDNETVVRFSLGQRPGGDEFIAPSEAKTDNNGRVTVNLSSGTKAGVVQVIAQTERSDGQTITSKPVSVTIHGGLPDQAHFTLGPERYNFAGLLASGLPNAASVIVGDKYGNPVRPGTAVYFTTSHGVIEGSVGTNAEGRGTVTLISGNPFPPDGIALVTAETADENQQRVFSQFPVVLSGYIVLTVDEAAAILGNTYSLTVTDQNGNPLAAGTSISVRAEGTKVKAVGNTSVTLEDTIFEGGMGYEHVLRGPGRTEFSFTPVEDLITDEDGTPKLEAITIRVSGPNGGLECVINSEPSRTTCGVGTIIAKNANGSMTVHGDLPR